MPIFSPFPENLAEVTLVTASTVDSGMQFGLVDPRYNFGDDKYPNRMSIAQFLAMLVANDVDGATTITAESDDALVVGRLGATTPALQIDTNATTSVTGLKVTAAAAAGGLALSTISSGTNESLTIDAKGSGTITLGSVSTGKVILPAGSVTPARQAITGDGAITIASGLVVLSKGSAAAITLAAPSSQDNTEITVISTTDFQHVITVTGGLWDGTTGANVTATFPAVKGGAITMIAQGTAWYVKSLNGVVCAP